MHGTAIHEAGHAVAGKAVGMIVDRVYLHEQGGTTNLRFHPEDHKNRATRWLIAIVAGPTAKAMAGEEVDLSTCSDDLDKVHLYATQMASCRSHELVREAAVLTADLLRRHWTVVEAVAEELLDRGALAGEDLMWDLS